MGASRSHCFSGALLKAMAREHFKLLGMLRVKVSGPQLVDFWALQASKGHHASSPPSAITKTKFYIGRSSILAYQYAMETPSWLVTGSIAEVRTGAAPVSEAEAMVIVVIIR
eukprot:6173079-Pleurochrysis_carterae.AAC.7